jgi:hypothetical protein
VRIDTSAHGQSWRRMYPLRQNSDCILRITDNRTIYLQ